MTKREKIKYLLIPAIGFGIGGAFWGFVKDLRLFQETSIVLGGALLLLISSFSLIAFEKHKPSKKALFVLLEVVAGTIIVFIYSTIIFFIAILDQLPFDSKLLSIFLIALLFLSGPVIVILFYTLILCAFLRIRLWPVLWRGTIGLALAFSLNLVLAISAGDFLSFLLAGIISGSFFGWGVYKAKQLKKLEKYNSMNT